MSAIDIHTHAFPDGLAKRAMEKLQQGFPLKPAGKGTVKSLLKSMDQANIDVSVVCAIATKPDQAQGIFDWCRSIRSDRIEAFPSVHPDTPDAAAWLHRFAEEGFAGIKLHPLYQAFAADEGRALPIYQAAQELGLVVAVHCGHDFAFPDGDDRADPVRFRRVLDRFEGLKLLCTHMGGWRQWDRVEQYLLGTPAYLETSFSLTELGCEGAVDMIRRHGTDRVLFGTDWPWQSQKEARQQVHELGLSEEENGKVLWSNAARLLKY